MILQKGRTTNHLLRNERKGFDRSIWVVAMIVLVLMFVALWFGGISGWLDGAAEELMSISDDWRDI